MIEHYALFDPCSRFHLVGKCLVVVVFVINLTFYLSILVTQNGVYSRLVMCHCQPLNITVS